MKKRAWILLAAALLASASLTAGIAAAASDARGGDAAFQEPDKSYILTDCNGHIGVFSGGKLILLTNVKLDDLRSSDRALLEAGIEVDSYEALMRLLQDFDE